MPSSISRVTALDHDRMQRLVRRACAPGPSQERWRDELVHLLHAHRVAEEETLTTDVVAAGGTEAVAAREGLRRVDQALDDATASVATMPVGSPELPGAGRALARLLITHAEVITEQVLRPLEASVTRKEIRRLGGVYTDRREQALRQHGTTTDIPRRLDLSRAELYDLARRAGIEGRSSMSRQDLISELQRRGESG